MTFTRLQKEEEETAQTFDYVPTSVDRRGHVVDQFGIRIQKTTRPPYVSPDEWMKMRPQGKRQAIVEAGSRLRDRLRIMSNQYFMPQCEHAENSNAIALWEDNTTP